jgi:hypothetical protein
MDMPGALIIHGVNDAHVERYARFIRKFGGLFFSIRGHGDYGRYVLVFPPKAEILEVREIRPEDDPDGAYTQTDIALNEEYYLTWYHNKKIGHPQEVHNRIVVPVTQLDEAGV